jgi:hypothetical protein
VLICFTTGAPPAVLLNNISDRLDVQLGHAGRRLGCECAFGFRKIAVERKDWRYAARKAGSVKVGGMAKLWNEQVSAALGVWS